MGTEPAPFGALLKRHRLAAGLTQQGLAERAGLSFRAVSDLERDPARLPRLDSVTRLADALALAPDERRAFLAAARPGSPPASAAVPPRAAPPDGGARPATRYARSGDVSVAYQVLGDGPVDLVLVPGAISHVEWAWEEPALARELRHLAAFARLIRFDRRGTGLSDRVTGAATMEERMEDIRAVMDAAGSARAVIYGVSVGAPLAILFAATYPERTLGLIIYGGGAAWVRQPDYPWAAPAEEQRRHLAARALTIHEGWGDPARVAGVVARMGPSRAHDARFVGWFAALERLGASPGGEIANQRLNLALDVRQVLPAIRVPTLVLHRTGDRVKAVGQGRYLADHIPGARFVELPGEDHFEFLGETAPRLDAMAAFIGAADNAREPGRVLATVLVAALAGPDADPPGVGYGAEFRALARREFARQRGQRVAVGDAALLGTFDGPVRAIRCAQALVYGADERGLALRAALHIGECDRRADRASGPAVAVATWLVAQADPGTVLVSGVVKDLVAGAGLAFADRGVRRCPGVPGAWRLHTLV